jgi:1-deoxy-D-xylulose-5-phosphate reductoisomerase
MKNICLLGASGSVGESTLKVLRQFPEKFKLHSFSVHSNLQKAKSIILEFYPKNLVVSGTNVDKNFLGKNFEGCNVLYGEEYLDEIVCHSEIHTVVTAIVGAIGIYPTLSAIRACKKIAIANKETLVTFGPYIQNLLKKFPSTLIPVDSEHNALFQLLEGKPKTSIRSLILTASGGPFREREISTLNKVTVEEALKHPTWKMGPKITIDSAGLINKSLEVIEAHFLFNLTYEQIEVVVHPESIVHGIVEFVDGSTTMYASHPDMVFPVAHSLFYPEFTPNILVERKPDSYPALHFFKPDTKRYPALNLAYQAGKKGGTAPAIFNAANEVAVELFLNKKIRFTQIPEKIDFALQMIPITFPEELDGFLEADSLARKLVMGE